MKKTAPMPYYLNNQAEIHTYLQQQSEEAQKTWQQIVAKADYQAFRKRLLARYQAKMSSANQ